MFNTIIIGAGTIGCGLEGSDQIFSHASAYQVNPRTKLIAIVDQDTEKLTWASEKWKCAGYSNFLDAAKHCNPEIISICVPDQSHAVIFNTILDNIQSICPKLIIVEKPVTLVPNESLGYYSKFKEAGIPVLVNYSRRFLPIYSEMRNFCRTDEILSATIKYGKGVMHNGCHAIDLGRYLFGNIKKYSFLMARHDHDVHDPSVSAFFEYDFCNNFYLEALHDRSFTHFEVDVISKGKRFIIDNDHTRLREFMVQEGQGVPQGKRMIQISERKVDHNLALSNMIAHAIDVIESNRYLDCDILEAFQSESIAHQLSMAGIQFLQRTETCTS